MRYLPNTDDVTCGMMFFAVSGFFFAFSFILLIRNREQQNGRKKKGFHGRSSMRLPSTITTMHNSFCQTKTPAAEILTLSLTACLTTY